MYHWWFLFRLNERRIVNAIAQAESRTSGEVRVFISHKVIEDALSEAEAQFNALGMAATRERNGVLLFIAPRSRKFAVYGDLGIHQRCGLTFWQNLVAAASAAFRQGKHTDGIISAIGTIGTRLAEHFPPKPDDADELPNDVVFG
jgi:uncharacterized membrane protein